ncbi:MAG TPA: erythromycin esterase family protein, partial [Blastocatellia bacterium]|nr:erythromycin esterase family protein [Blastocatellia bacterium]
GLDPYFLDLHARQPHSVRAWLNAPTKTRLIGPHYNPDNDPAYHMSGGSLADWFDIIVHSQEVTPALFLT